MEIRTKQLAAPFILTVIENNHEAAFKRSDELWNQKKDAIEGEGFEKGHVPRSYAEKKIGVGTLYRELFDELLSEGIQKCERRIVNIEEYHIDLFQKGQPAIISAKVYFEPNVLDAQYKNIAIEAESVEVRDKELEATISRIRANNAKCTETDAPVESGNIVYIDFVGRINGETYQGGDIKNFAVEVGSNKLILGFEKELIGHKVNDEWSFKLALAKDFLRQDLAGKEVEYTVKILKIQLKNLPNLDDQFAITLGYESLQEMKKQLYNDILAEKQKISQYWIDSEVLKKITLAMKMEPIPDAMIVDEIDFMFKEMIAAVNLTEEQYFKRTGSTKEQYQSEHWYQSANYVKARLLLQFVAEKENIQVTDEDREAQLKKLAQQHKADVEEIKKQTNFKNLDIQIKRAKAHQVIMSSAQVVYKEKGKDRERATEYKSLLTPENQAKASTLFGRDEDKKIIKLGQ